MKVIKHDELKAVGMEYTEIKVRAEKYSCAYYVFPKKIIEKSLSVLDKCKIYYDLVPADNDELYICNSKYITEPEQVAEAIAVHTDIEIDEFYEIIDYVNTHEESIMIDFFKTTELPEFSVILCEETTSSLESEIKMVLEEYMKILLDMSDSDRWGAIVAAMEKNKFGPVLKYYTKTVQDYILSNMSKRMVEDIKESIE